MTDFEDRVEQDRLAAQRLLNIDIDPDMWLKSKTQQVLASEGRAENQCPCGAYTTTGDPPILHRKACPHDPFPVIEPVDLSDPKW